MMERASKRRKINPSQPTGLLSAGSLPASIAVAPAAQAATEPPTSEPTAETIIASTSTRPLRLYNLPSELQQLIYHHLIISGPMIRYEFGKLGGLLILTYDLIALPMLSALNFGPPSRRLAMSASRVL